MNSPVSTQPRPKRVTLKFKSDSGKTYLYDDATGNIFPWGVAEECALKRELDTPLTASEQEAMDSCPSAELAEKGSFVRRWKTQYNAFARLEVTKFAVPTAEQVAFVLRHSCLELILIVTEKCNLRCKYCVYSGAYSFHRKATAKEMDCATAIRAVDWFHQTMSPYLGRHPLKKYGLSFYGGEPLLNLKVIRAVLEHARAKYQRFFQPVMTTNGLLLTLEVAALLVEHNVQIAISIDGPENEHDRLRVDGGGHGTYRRIIENLARIKEKYPQYWASNITSASVYDVRSNIEKTARFFEANKDVIPRSVFVNQVSNRNTNYYDGLTQRDYDLFNARWLALREDYKKAKIENLPTDSYTTILGGFPIVRTLLRSRMGDHKPAFLPFGGCCMPGSRIAVHYNGKIDMCERVNGTFPIGDLNQEGLHYARIAEIIQEYQEKILYRCSVCPATRLCSQCFSFAETKGGFVESKTFCQNTIRAAVRSLADYVSILEANKAANFDLETDVSAIEKRVLLIC